MSTSILQDTSVSEKPDKEKRDKEKREKEKSDREFYESVRRDSSRSGHPFLAGLVIVVLVAMGGLGWYGYEFFKTHGSPLDKIRGIQATVGALDNQMKNAEAKFAELTANHDDLRQRMDKLGQDFQAGLASARKQTNQASEALWLRVQNQLDAELGGIRAKVANLEAVQNDDQTRIADLRQELSRVQAQLNQESEALAAARRQLDQAETAANEQFTSLRESERSDRSDVDRITNDMAVERVGFEATKGHIRELAPGISLQLTRTDLAYQRVNGSMWFGPDHRTIWLRGQSVQEPVVFYGLSDGKKRELVITHVARNSVVGYLILPKVQAMPGD